MGTQIIENELSDYIFNDPNLNNDYFSEKNTPSAFKRIETASQKTKGKDKVLQINQIAPDWVLPVIKGGTISLSELKGKVVLLEFSGVHCGYCLVAVPELKKIQDKFKDDNFQLVSIYSDEEKDKLIKYVDRYAITYPILLNGKEQQKQQSVREKYGVSGIPHFFLINKQGYISNIWLGYSEDLSESLIKEIEVQLNSQYQRN